MILNNNFKEDKEREMTQESYHGSPNTGYFHSPHKCEIIH